MEIAGAGGEVPHYDRNKELKAFDETKAGVKGLVDAGIQKIPRIFVRTLDELTEDLAFKNEDNNKIEIPLIDLQGMDQRRKEIIDEVRVASETWGFFQLVNHGIPVSVTNEMIQGVRRFHEEDVELKKQLYKKDLSRKVQFDSNFDLYKSRSANWRDTLRCLLLTPDPINPQELPDTCRDIVVDYWKHIMNLGGTLTELFSEALGLNRDHLKGMDCTQCLTLGGHYYPACPEPELTQGTTQHSDPSFFTILLQDCIGGLQILNQSCWVSVKPIPGALIVNIGDLLQLISNGKLKSAEHRVLANRVGPRVSVACFFRGSTTRLYGPIEELSDENSSVYKHTTVKDYTAHYNCKGLNRVSALDHFKL
ncbi:hypothetical protein MKW98_031513 [Papaver atlanticum]|uniref:Fe2OG dioxygenase domain-containing protein n=1 Tax=Papaver atlanticum TaxID=357466 RepID=A0AAD4S5V3_9MAGN|nr:hypothetical protein MKW98_031513 [Papaver atlanticum]